MENEMEKYTEREIRKSLDKAQRRFIIAAKDLRGELLSHTEPEGENSHILILKSKISKVKKEKQATIRSLRNKVIWRDKRIEELTNIIARPEHIKLLQQKDSQIKVLRQAKKDLTEMVREARRDYNNNQKSQL